MPTQSTTPQLDIRNGKATGLPATRAIRVFDVRVVDGMVEIDLEKKS